MRIVCLYWRLQLMDAIIDFWKRIQWSFSIYYHGLKNMLSTRILFARLCNYFFNTALSIWKLLQALLLLQTSVNSVLRSWAELLETNELSCSQEFFLQKSSLNSLSSWDFCQKVIVTFWTWSVLSYLVTTEIEPNCGACCPRGSVSLY